MNTNHSPLPWRPYNASGSRVFKTWRIRGDADDSVIAIIPDDSRHSTERIYANAQYIVQACNAHPALVAALEDVIRDFTVIECTRCDGTGNRLAHPDEACHVCAGAGEIVPQQAWPQFVKQARAALALARGGKGESK